MTRYLRLRLARLGSSTLSLAALVAVVFLPRLAVVLISVMLAALVASLVFNVLLRQELVRRLDQVRAQNGGELPAPAPGAMRRAVLPQSIGLAIGLAGIVVLAILVPELRIPALIAAGVIVVLVPLIYWRARRRFDLLRHDSADPTDRPSAD